MFLSIICINAKSVQYTLEKRRGGEDAVDFRGKHEPVNKTSPETRESVRKHNMLLCFMWTLDVPVNQHPHAIVHYLDHNCAPSQVAQFDYTKM